jgi:hypothetical protein
LSRSDFPAQAPRSVSQVLTASNTASTRCAATLLVATALATTRPARTCTARSPTRTEWPTRSTALVIRTSGRGTLAATERVHPALPAYGAERTSTPAASVPKRARATPPIRVTAAMAGRRARAACPFATRTSTVSSAPAITGVSSLRETPTRAPRRTIRRASPMGNARRARRRTWACARARAIPRPTSATRATRTSAAVAPFPAGPRSRRAMAAHATSAGPWACRRPRMATAPPSSRWAKSPRARPTAIRGSTVACSAPSPRSARTD